MPTAARLAGAVLFAALAWYISEQLKPLFPEGRDLGKLSEINACIALAVGWIVVGSRAGIGYRGAIGYGITGLAAVVFWCLLLQSFGEMIRKSLRKQYDGPVEALVAVFEEMIEFGQLLLTPHIFLSLIIGGIGAGLVTEIIFRRFPE